MFLIFPCMLPVLPPHLRTVTQWVGESWGRVGWSGKNKTQGTSAAIQTWNMSHKCHTYPVQMIILKRFKDQTSVKSANEESWQCHFRTLHSWLSADSISPWLNTGPAKQHHKDMHLRSIRHSGLFNTLLFLYIYTYKCSTVCSDNITGDHVYIM